MSDSPPPEESRGKALSPVSPKPILFPSPSNVPILEKQMEPAFEASAASGALLGSNAADANRLARQQLPGAVQNGFKAQVDNESSERTEHTSTENHQIISSNLLSQPTQPSGVSPGDATAVSEAASSVINPSIEPPLNASVAEPKNDPAPIGFSETNQPNPAPDPTAPAHDSNAGGVDFQTLLAQLSHTPVNPLQTEGAQNAAPPAALLEGAQTSPSSSIPTAFLGNPNLPPRPPPQEKPATHPNYNPADDIRSYHPHSQQNLAASYRAQNSPQTLNTNAPGMSPPVPPFQQTPNSAQPPAHSPITPSYRQRDAFEPRPDSAGTQTQWSPEVEQIYAQFLRDESANVAEGRWERFPPGSRLFVGNLPTEKVNKRDLFERFYRYGTLAQISIKQAFGFVQFLDEDACHRALNGEQGVTVAGRKMHLEISKPQRNTNKGNNRDGGRRRSRSPDYNRGGRRSIDRYSSSGHGDSRDQNFRRGRDDYRPRRDRDRGRSPDDYYTTGEPVPRRPLSSEPVNSDNHSANLLLQLPLRTGAAVPDVQIIYDPRDLGSHSSFPASVQKMMERVGLTANILTIDAPGIEDALVSRCVMEGVIAITKPTFDMWAAFDISFKIYSRNGTNVRFDEYKKVQLDAAAQLILQAKNTAGRPPHPPLGHGMPSAFPAAPAYISPPSQAQIPLSNPDLSRLLSSLGTSTNPSVPNPLPTSHQPPPGSQTDLARLLSQLSQQPGAPAPAPPPAAAAAPPPAWSPQPPATQSRNNMPPNRGYAFAAAPPPNPNPPTPTNVNQPRPPSQQANPPGQPDMQEMLNQLAQYSR